MAPAIQYCAACGTRIEADEIAQGNAASVGDTWYCAGCFDALPVATRRDARPVDDPADGASSEADEATLSNLYSAKPARHDSAGRTRGGVPHGRHASGPRAARRAGGPRTSARTRPAWVVPTLVGVATTTVLVLVGWALLGDTPDRVGPTPPPPTVASGQSVATRTDPVPASPAERPATRPDLPASRLAGEIAATEAHDRAHPDRLLDRLARWRALARAASDTDDVDRVGRRIADLEREVDAEAAVAFAEIEREVALHVAAGRFAEALGALGRFPPRLSSERWTAAIHARRVAIEAARDLADRTAALPPVPVARIALFDGRDLGAWTIDHPDCWSVEAGALRGKTAGQASLILAGAPHWRDYALGFEIRRLTGIVSIYLRRASSTDRFVMSFTPETLGPTVEWRPLRFEIRGMALVVTSPGTAYRQEVAIKAATKGPVGFLLSKDSSCELRAIAVDRFDAAD